MKRNTPNPFESQSYNHLLMVLLMMLCSFSAGVFAADPFDCGSTGTNGAWNITQSTNIALPPDGIFNCTTINVAAGVTLGFIRNPLNTPVYLLATGDVQIDGTVDVSGSGYLAGPGGFDGGFAGLVYEGYQRGSDGFGPGGGMGGVPDSRGLGSFEYGNKLLIPLIGGSGGGGWGTSRGGGGGGAILIASNARITISGVVQSRAGTGAWNGSAGAIRLVAPIVTGNGALSSWDAVNGAGVNIGRIRIDCTDFLSWRNLSISGGKPTIGARMIVFPSVIPRLDIVEAAGTSIPEGTSSEVVISLPLDSPTNQVVKVQARNFTNDVPIRVVVTPENAPSVSYDTVISQGSGNPPSTNVDVILSAGQIYHINTWTR